MSQFPDTPEQFSTAVYDLVRRRHGSRTVELVTTLGQASGTGPSGTWK